MESKTVKVREVLHLTGISRTTLWRLERDGLFPKKSKTNSFSTVWDREKVMEWIAKRDRESAND